MACPSYARQHIPLVNTIVIHWLSITQLLGGLGQWNRSQQSKRMIKGSHKNGVLVGGVNQLMKL